MSAAKGARAGGKAPRRGRALLSALLAPIVLTTTATLTGTALAPKLLVSAPLLLIALNPVSRHLILVSPVTELGPYLAVAVTRLFLPDPFYFAIGRLWGKDAIAWVERRLGGAGRLVRGVEALFERAGWLVLMLAPVGLVCVLAGASRMSVRTFVLLNLAATVTWALIVRRLGDVFAGPVALVRQFVADNVLLLTGVSVLLVVIQLILQRRRSRQGTRAQGKDQELG
ncbi:MAG: VTT domain-containing protein [Polyangiaceae bacterium]